MKSKCKTQLKLAAWTCLPVTNYYSTHKHYHQFTLLIPQYFIYDCRLVFLRNSLLVLFTLAFWKKTSVNLTRHYAIYCMYVCLISTESTLCEELLGDTITHFTGIPAVCLPPPSSWFAHFKQGSGLCRNTSCTCMSEPIKYRTNLMKGFGSSQVSSPSTQKSKRSIPGALK